MSATGVSGDMVQPGPGDRFGAKYTMMVAVMLTGVEAHQIRRYEAAGLLKPARTRAGRRLYSDAEVQRIREIAQLQSRGINLQGAREVLELRRRREEWMPDQQKATM